MPISAQPQLGKLFVQLAITRQPVQQFVRRLLQVIIQILDLRLPRKLLVLRGTIHLLVSQCVLKLLLDIIPI
jgi:hypothetical protein